MLPNPLLESNISNHVTHHLNINYLLIAPCSMSITSIHNILGESPCLVLYMGFTISIFIFLIVAQGNALSLNYYDNTCPGVEDTVTKVVTNAVKKDKTVPAAVLRMHFHDCFIRVYIYIYIQLSKILPLCSPIPTRIFHSSLPCVFLEPLICSIIDFLARAVMRLCC